MRPPFFPRLPSKAYRQRTATAIVSPVGTIFILLLFLMFLAAALFAVWPRLDIAVARLFYGGDGRFPSDAGVGRLVRPLGEIVPWCLAVGASAAYLARRLLPGFFTGGPSGRGLVFVLLSLALGPGLLVNVVLKEHSHRPRPVQVVEFGGTETFRPFYRFDGACKRNCSFVSGEAAMAVWSVAPAMLAPAPWRAAAVAAAFGFGAAIGLLRMAFGHHFLTDVLFGCIFTIFIILGLYRALRLPRQQSRHSL